MMMCASPTCGGMLVNDVNAVLTVNRHARADGIRRDVQKDRQNGVQRETHLMIFASVLNTRSQMLVVTPKLTSAR